MKTVVLLSKVFFDIRKLGNRPILPKRKRRLQAAHGKKQLCVLGRKIAALKKQGGTLCIRQWSGKPYRSQQETILEVPASVVGIQKMGIVQTDVSQLSVQVDAREVPISEIAKNDGLNSVEFSEFLQPVLKTSEGNKTIFAVIHFTNFRY